jgi:hydrogenase/urease accessory protein HupE
MSKLAISLAIGIGAGVLDIIPMILQKLDKYAISSAFVHWVILGFIISYIKLPLPSWLSGITVAVLTALPVVILVAKEDPRSIVPILGLSVVLGAIVGTISSKLVP